MYKVPLEVEAPSVKSSYAPSVGNSSVAPRGSSLKSPGYSPETVVIMGGTRIMNRQSSSMSDTDSLGIVKPHRSMFRRDTRVTSMHSERVSTSKNKEEVIDMRRYSLMPKNVNTEEPAGNLIFPSRDPIETRKQFDQSYIATSIRSARSPRSKTVEQSDSRSLRSIRSNKNAPTPLRIPRSPMLSKHSPSPSTTPILRSPDRRTSTRPKIPKKDRRLTGVSETSEGSFNSPASVSEISPSSPASSVYRASSPIVRRLDPPVSLEFSIKVVRAGSLKIRE
jgi:hypothetical protein